MPENAIRCIVYQINLALQYLHKKNIIFRGVCARHILIDKNGIAKLNNFKHAICIDDCNQWIGEKKLVYNFDDSLQDVLIFLAPEILKQDLQGYGIKSDIYSLGITICEIGNGFAPFREMEPLQILYEKIQGSIPFLLDASNLTFNKSAPSLHSEEYHKHKRSFTYSMEINDFVAKSLLYNPTERPTSLQLSNHKFLMLPTSEYEDYFQNALSKLLKEKCQQLVLLNE